ncbi:hypothetical protein Patl1_00577 [Pistacia atlantica]|uniref:Uncharacterized protein n=1 Tax=Pistacia atlantica TaxID=434234 RepID=A0ACC1CA16_9ROSI|nr:hypothetical protein Patl1_00577 [Pistacia atlantica]
MGHLIPLIEFAKRLVQQHQFAVTFIIPTDGAPTKAQKSILASLPSSINSIFLPPVTLDDAPENTKIETLISLTLVRSLPSLRDALKSLVANTSLVSLVVDLFGTDAFDVAKEFNLSPFIFFPSTAMALSLFLYLPILDASVSCEYRDLPEPVNIPGCIPIHGKYLLDPVQDRKNEAYKWVLHHTKRYRMAEGIMVNSFMELEGGAIKALQEAEPGKPPVYPVGPLVKMGSSTRTDDDESLKWLDTQPLGSVLFVSFGSGGTLSSRQLNELALGLEMSEQRFLWVVRSPNDEVANATYFGVHGQNEFLKFLPGRVFREDQGARSGGAIVGTTGTTWPLYAEQKMNAVTLTEHIQVALRPKASENGLYGKEEIARVVKGLMEGEEGKSVRYRMKDLKDAAAAVLNENGSSTKALTEVALKWKNKISN